MFRMSLIEKGDEIALVPGKHNHEPNEQPIRQKRFIAHLKEQIRENAMTIRKIFPGEIFSRYTVEGDSVRLLAQFKQIKSSFYRVKNMNSPPLPKSIEDLSIEGKKLIRSFLMNFFLKESGGSC